MQRRNGKTIFEQVAAKKSFLLSPVRRTNLINETLVVDKIIPMVMVISKEIRLDQRNGNG